MHSSCIMLRNAKTASRSIMSLTTLGRTSVSPRTEQRLNIAKVLGHASEKTHIYVCGPERLPHAVKDAAKRISFPESNISSEAFAVSTSGDLFVVEIEIQSKEL